MKRDKLEPEMEIFRSSVRKFLQTHVRAHWERWRAEGIIDRDVYLKAGEAGLLCMWADEKYGGLGIKDMRYEQILIEENAAHGDPGLFTWLHSRIIAPYIGNLGNEEQKQRFLPGAISGESILAVAMTEPGAGSDLAGMKTYAKDMGGYWLLNGSKTFISNGINADVVIVAAKTDPESRHAMTLFIVERDMPGFERGRSLIKMGLKSNDTAELFFDDVKVPKENVLGEVNMGFKHLMNGLAEERLIAAINNLAHATHAFNISKAYVSERTAFGKPLSEFQNTRFKLAELNAELDALQIYLDCAVTRFNGGELSSQDASRAKLLTSELYGRVVDTGVQLHGGSGYMEEYEICRMYQDERIHRILAGTSEIMKEIISREIFS